MRQVRITGVTWLRNVTYAKLLYVKRRFEHFCFERLALISFAISSRKRSAARTLCNLGWASLASATVADIEFR